VNAKLENDAAERQPPIQRFCRYLTELSPQPMVAVEGITHIITYLNPAFAELVQNGKSNLVGRPFAEAVPEGAANGCLALLDRVFRTGIPEILADQEHCHTYPGPVYWSYSVWAILGEDERPAEFMLQVTDSTESALFRRQARAMNESLMISSTRQHELTEVAESLSKRLQASVQLRDHFLAVLSHELRNPLAALSSEVQLLKLSATNPVTVTMERQLKHLVRLVDDLLDVSRISTGKLEIRKERVDLQTILREAVEASRPLIDRGSHKLTFTPPVDPIFLDADRTRLVQVFSNLLNNAAKYSDPDGHIQLSVTRDGNEVVVSVRDAGIGIPHDRLSHIFQVFVQVDTSWQRAQGGLGIGLSLVKEFVELHGGRVEVRSEGRGNGSEFIVRLPMLTPDRISAVSSTREPLSLDIEQSNAPKRRIIVVDDNIDAADSLAMILRFMGHEVRTAHDGEAGVALAVEFRPELVLMDIGMPRLNGYEAARRIRAEPWDPQPLLVALTGWGAEDDRQRTRDAGFDRHLVKPVSMDSLTRMIAEMPRDPRA